MNMSKKERTKQMETAKDKLVKRKFELEDILTSLSKTQAEENDGVQDIGDQAISSSMEALRSSYQENEQEEYHRIVRALDAIKNDTYGICIDCGNPISEKRLKYFPDALRCLACQELADGPEE